MCMIYAKLLFIFITTKIIGVIRQYVWRLEKCEVSDIQAAKHLIIVAPSRIQHRARVFGIVDEGKTKYLRPRRPLIKWP